MSVGYDFRITTTYKIRQSLLVDVATWRSLLRFAYLELGVGFTSAHAVGSAAGVPRLDPRVAR